MGSGEVESAHRYVLQKRLKISGAWWDINQAKSMIALRVKRAKLKNKLCSILGFYHLLYLADIEYIKQYSMIIKEGLIN